MATFESVISDLNALDDTLRRGLVRDADTITAPVAAQAQIYGPELPNQVYQRTNNLAEGWEQSQVATSVTGGGVRLSHTNPVEYAMFVQGVDNQAPLFASRWDDLQEVADKASEATEARIATSIAESLRGAF